MLETGVGRGSGGGPDGVARWTALTAASAEPSAARRAVPDSTSESQPCDLVTVPARQGLEAVDILRLRDGVGPVLHDRAGDTLGFLVPPGTAAFWDLPGSACTQTFPRRSRSVPPEPPVAGTGWLVPPDGAHRGTTEPAELRAALGEAARTIEAVDRCG